MSSTLFISDLHLDPARPASTRALANFLQNNGHCERLYILGDLFEAWVGDDENSPLADEVREMLRRFSANGPALYIMPGNRDFFLGQDFCAQVDGYLLDDPTVVDLFGEPTLLMHGDSLCTADHDYQAFRRTARDPEWQARVMASSLEERRALAAELRAKSREATSNKPADIMDVTLSEVDRVMREHGVSRMIHGHTHMPAEHPAACGTRGVLGDWTERGWAIEASRHSVKLYNFALN
mgnify:CR=1 FL=1